MPCTGRNGCLLVVRIRFAIFTIVRLIPQACTWETNCAYAPPNCLRIGEGGFLHPLWWQWKCLPSLPQFNILYSDRIILYLQLSRLTNMCYYSTRTATVRVTQLESIPLGRLPPHNRESHTLIRITKICSVTELHRS
jgi:hypothetical protein